MTSQTKILSFDDAKHAAASRRHAYEAELASARHASLGVHARRTAGLNEVEGLRESERSREVGLVRAARMHETSRANGANRMSETSRSRGSHSPSYASRSFDATRTSGTARASEENDSSEASSQPSKFAQMKRKLLKSKAERAFDKRYGGDRSGGAGGKASGDASQAGSRAAVYKGEMGSSHRRAARMQNAESPNPSSKRSARFAPRIIRSPRFVAGVAVVACMVFACLYLYPSAKQYYLSVRECDRLQAEYSAIDQRNEAIKSEVAALETADGVADRAREELGWVKSDENAVTVRGLNDVEEESTFTANIVAGSTEAPETWYSVWLDPLFGVE